MGRKQQQPRPPALRTEGPTDDELEELEQLDHDDDQAHDDHALDDAIAHAKTERAADVETPDPPAEDPAIVQRRLYGR